MRSTASRSAPSGCCSARAPASLTVSTSPNFAAKWLVHRLGRFAEAHPGIDLRISATLHHVDFAREDVDLAVRHGDGQAAGLHVTRLCTEELLPVCSPKLLAGRQRPAQAVGPAQAHAAAPRRPERTGRSGSRRPAWQCRSVARTRAEPGQHGDRCRRRRPGRRARPHRARRLGSHQRTPGAPVRAAPCRSPRPTGSSAPRRRRRCRRSSRFATGCWPRPPRTTSGSSLKPSSSVAIIFVTRPAAPPWASRCLVHNTNAAAPIVRRSCTMSCCDVQLASIWHGSGRFRPYILLYVAAMVGACSQPADMTFGGKRTPIDLTQTEVELVEECR